MAMIIIKGSLHENFGDQPTNKFLGQALSKQAIQLVDWNYTDAAYMMCGSLLQFANAKNIVWGTGFMYENDAIKAPPKQIRAVRGKLSRNKLVKMNIDCPEVYGDPALLYPKFYAPTVSKQYRLGIIPHYIDKDNANIKRFKHEDTIIIDIMAGYESVIKQILSCEKIVSSALHGIIAADAYHVPSMWIQFSDKVLGNGFKFKDYFSSVNRQITAPFVVTEKTTIQDFLALFSSYEIKIDLNQLYEVCPLKNL